MIRFHSLLGKKCLCPLFMASATPRERVNPWGQVLQASNSPPDASASIIQVQSSNVYDTLAYEVQGMLPAARAVFTLPRRRRTVLRFRIQRAVGPGRSGRCRSEMKNTLACQRQ